MKKPLHSNCRRAVILIPVFAALTVSACGGAGYRTAQSEYAVMGETQAAPYEQMAKADMSEDMSMDMSMESSNSALTSSTGSMEVIPTSRKLIRSAALEVETDQFDNLIQLINDQITTTGGYTENSVITDGSLYEYNEPKRRHGSITARIPQAKLNGFITLVEQNGNITNRSESATDVTLQYSDIESRKKSLTIEQERIWALLEKADTLEAVIVLEQRLSDIRYQLESMESQLRLYDNQVDYSIVTLNISEVLTFTPTSPESVGERIQKGLTKNTNSLVSFVTGFFIGLVSSSPIWIPLGLIAALILFFIRRHQTKRRLKKAAAAAANHHQAAPQDSSTESTSEEEKP